MRRALRHLFTLLSAISLLLCVAVCLIWKDSHRAVGWFRVSKYRNVPGIWGDRLLQVESRAGGFSIQHISDMASDPQTVKEYSETYPAGWKVEAHREVGVTAYPRLDPFRPAAQGRIWFDAIVYDRPTPFNRLASSRLVTVIFPHAAVVGTLLMLPACWGVCRMQKGSRRTRGLCPRCGYDLRASPERCPECGTPTAGLLTAGPPAAGAANPRAAP